METDDDDDMDDTTDTTKTNAIPTNTTSDGEVVSSTCALCREGGNLTTRPLGKISFLFFFSLNYCIIFNIVILAFILFGFVLLVIFYWLH